MRLDGFESNDNQNLAHVRLTTPYSGRDEKSGLHLMVEGGTRLAVAWSGNFDESLFLLGNLRFNKTKLESPSLWLDSALLTHLRGVTVKTDLDVHVDLATHLDSTRPLILTADGARADMIGGEFKTGMPGVS